MIEENKEIVLKTSRHCTKLKLFDEPILKDFNVFACMTELEYEPNDGELLGITLNGVNSKILSLFEDEYGVNDIAIQSKVNLQFISKVELNCYRI